MTITGEQAAANLTTDVKGAKIAIERGDWLDAGLSVTNVALDVIGIAGDPLGAVGSAGFGWIIQHISFLREPFDALLGDADSITGSARGWARAGDELVAAADTYRQAVPTETGGWHGSAGEAYRRAAATQAEGLDALAEVSRGVGAAISGAGKLLAEVRKAVLDFIDSCVQKVITIIIEALAKSWLSFGASIAEGIARSVAEAVRTARKIMGEVQKFISSLRKIMATVQKIVTLAKSVKQLLETIGGRANQSPTATTRQAAPVDTSGIDAAADRRYTTPATAGPAYTSTAAPDYRPNQFQFGATSPGPTYQRSAVPSQQPNPPSYGPSGPPPDPGVPASRVDRARWIGSAVEILVSHGVDPAKIDAEQIARIVDRASGGNPHAMNLDAPGAADGTPAKGLTQITDPVFQRHQVPGHGDIWQPVDNLLAGIRYFLARWGSLLAALDGAFDAE
ncbi:WXG100-like domain-containing protein [Actinokineospora iranica]|uniref:Transglycosylase SLT domain-containing protein n=1 Tax=Actinokineospora iranica TaxID=1271860 RepID=A0A1G6TKB2_9PSEU|nr:hypothetical protein [Actinokineospora iranica]SDD28946.1 hypothetical protein SAMN05216174_109166 [Actinokineospora iranica]